uniref:AP complex subunit sigma n=1 Tax=Phaeocystis antarctica TaxID=33657 RepID=A0A7S0DXX4_9EUKA|mmetsp:Transcript_11446/g.26918  ORF Transcript_11446/g.26918 Transcript_11446/m.26918 type:complete len:169 (+) Transcript_11446:1-507(+)
MILAISIINNFGKCRFIKLYREHMAEQQQQIVVKELFSTLNTRPDGVCNFIDASKWFGKGARIVYRQYATLYFIFAIDASESELGILDLIQVMVEALDRNFKNVCELDIIFNVEQVHWVVDEMVVGGMVAETNMNDILDAVESQARLARQEQGIGNGGVGAQGQPPSF